MEPTVLTAKLNQLPETMQAEVADFVDFLLEKAQRQNLLVKPVKNRPAGLAAGQYEMGRNFDEPLDDFNEYM